MALISCPHCGKQISDKSEVCVHCREKLLAVPQETKEVHFDKLSASKQQAIFAEFISAYPEHDYGEAGLHQISYAMIYVFLLALLLEIGVHFADLDSPNGTFLTTIPLILPVILNIFVVIVSICLGISYHGYTKKALIGVKVFQKWLKEKKGMIYIPELAGKKQKKIFDGINTENYPLR